MTRRFIRFSTPVMCNETFWGLGTSLFPTIMGHMEGSQEILAAYAIAGNITNLCTVGVFAISGTAAILIGQEIGSGRADRVYSLGALLNALAFLFGLAAGLLFLGLLHWFVIPVLYPLFGLSSAAGDICTMMLTVVFTMMPLRSFECTNIVGVLRGGGDVKMATLIDLTPPVGGGAAPGGSLRPGIQSWHILGVPVHDERKRGQGNPGHPPVPQWKVDQRRHRPCPTGRRDVTPSSCANSRGMPLLEQLLNFRMRLAFHPRLYYTDGRDNHLQILEHNFWR